MQLDKLLTRLLSAEGYDVRQPGPVEGRSGATYAVSLVATRDGVDHLVDVVTQRPVGSRDLKALRAIRDDAGFDHAILFALEGAEHDASDGEGLGLWTRDQVAHRLGELLLDGVDLADVEGPENAIEVVSVQLESPPPREGPGEEPARSDEGQPVEVPAATEVAAPTPEAAAATPADDDGSDAEWLTPPPEPQVEPEPASPTADEVADDGSDAEWLTDPPEPAEAAAPVEEADPPEVADDGSDAEWLTSKPSAPPAQEVPAPEPTPQPDDGSDAQWLSGSPVQASAPEPASPTADEVADDGSDAQWLSSSATPAAEAPPESAVEQDPVPEPRQPAAPAEEAADERFRSGRSLPLEVGEREARRIAEGPLFSTKSAELELLPFHVYRYTCTLAGEGHTREADGHLWVSANSGQVAPAPEVALVDELPVPFTRQGVQVPSDDAETAVAGYIQEHLTVREEVSNDFGESAIIERVELRARSDTIQVEHRGVAYAPQWRVTGTNGTVLVDGVTGDLVQAR